MSDIPKMHKADIIILRLNLSPYQIDEVAPSCARFNYGTPCKIFEIKGTKLKSRWSIKVHAGMIDYKGEEIKGYPIEWNAKHDPKLLELEKRLNFYFPTAEDGEKFRLSRRRVQYFNEEIKELE